MHNFEEQYLSQVINTINKGTSVMDRTGTGTTKLFGAVYRHDLRVSFPLLTTKFVSLKNNFHELKWMLSASTNTKYLVENGCTIWDEWADEHGELPHVYGKQWGKWEDTRMVLRSDWNNGVYDDRGFADVGVCHDMKKMVIHREINQVDKIIEGLKNEPEGRRHMISAWNVAYIDDMRLPPCHVSYDFVKIGNTLNCLLFMRSNDQGLGLPYNKSFLGLFTTLMAKQVGLIPAEIMIVVGDSHVYNNHINDDMLFKQLKRLPRPAPQLEVIVDRDSIYDYEFEDLKLIGYNPHPGIKMEVSV